MKNVSPTPAMLALGWLLSSETPAEQKITEAIKALRLYGFDEGQPLAKQPEAHHVGVSLITGRIVTISDPKGLLNK